MQTLVVETTSECNLRCIMCPTIACSGKKGIMDGETFSRIQPYFPRFGSVVLNGWGEPLIDPHIFERIRAAKQAGCTVGIGTNASLLTGDKARAILASGLDSLYLSLDAATPATYEQIRAGASFKTATDNIGRFMRFRGSEKRPAVEAHFVLMRKNLNELPQFVRLMGMLGVKHIVAKNLNVITKPTDVADVLHDFFGNPVGALVRDATIEAARAEAASLGVSFTFWGGFTARKLDVCIADPTSAMFIGWDGEVSPCCKLGHNTPTILRDGTLLRNLRFSFGNVCKTDLDRITSGEEYYHFIHTMKSGRIPSQCDGCTLLYGL